jgi:hypothetical protein
MSHMTCNVGKTFCQGVLPFLVCMPDVDAAKSNAADMRHAEMSHVAMDVAEDGKANVGHADMGDADMNDADVGNADMNQCLQRYFRLTLDLSSCRMCVMLMLGTHTGRAPAMIRYAASL